MDVFIYPCKYNFINVFFSKADKIRDLKLSVTVFNATTYLDRVRISDIEHIIW